MARSTASFVPLLIRLTFNIYIMHKLEKNILSSVFEFVEPKHTE